MRPTLEKAKAVVKDETSTLDVRMWAATVLCRLLPPLVGNRIRARVLRLAGVRVGRGTTFGGSVHVSSGYVPGQRAAHRLSIGSDCWINAGCMFDLSAAVAVGNGVSVAQEVSFITNTHEIGPSNNRAGRRVSLPIEVGSGTWIGSRSTILPGVTIGSGCIVAAGSMVTRSVEPDTLVAGVPARIVRQLP